MRTFPIAMAGAAILVAAMLTSSLVASPQGTPRFFEYLQLDPGLTERGGNARRLGYRACSATVASDEWTCREFESQRSLDSALQTALATLGNEGWELVSVMNEVGNPWGDPTLKSYLFKRQQPR